MAIKFKKQLNTFGVMRGCFIILDYIILNVQFNFYYGFQWDYCISQKRELHSLIAHVAALTMRL